VAQKILHDSKHRLCALGLKLGSDKAPSNVCMRLLSTRKVTHTPCTCGIPFSQHQSDWNGNAKDETRESHRSICDKVYRDLVRRDVLGFNVKPNEGEHKEQANWFYFG